MTLPAESRTAVLRAPRAITIERMPLRRPADDEALVRVDACGVCGSDVSIYTGERDEQLYPVVMGHEIAATVVAIGAAAASRRRLRPGDRILLEELIPCHSCGHCLAGAHRRCPYGTRYGANTLRPGADPLGGFAEYLTVPAHALHHPLPEGVAADTATLAIPLSNGLSWIRDAGALRPGDTVVIQGPGQSGLACVVAARLLGAGTVIVSGTARDGARLEAARRLGADRVVQVDDEDLTDVVNAMTAGAGADVVVDAVPLATTTLPTAIRCAALGGRIVVAGAKRGRLTDAVPTDLLYQREVTVRGVAARQSWALTSALQILATDAVDLRALSGESFDLDSVDRALSRMADGGTDRPAHVTVVPS
ncbi:zinc-dependent alcohol dehydrogenase [Micromonospora radicis]|uniref:Enoyl reductase (ER) domain-containing protein n=1 Tax=Micromonospora radicis TaxID=1894971 RepID=A0A418MXE5_9ACTN|nr:alcohol dehydrogenase catalytic domain-containing protein [Micromonospora radicis]RIV39228.1 hypothetical protein D2L64_10285 [Micromonospora radicis]